MRTVVVVALALLGLAQCKEAPKTGASAEPAKDAAAVILEEARGYALATQAALGGTLQHQIAEKGVVGAIGFCNLRALPITDSVAALHHVDIRRITDQARNPANRADDAETDMMVQMRQALAAGNVPEGRMLPDADGRHYYFPIVTNDLCLKCHGTPGEDITEEVLDRLRDLYPADQATGYRSGQLRGLWKITPSETL